MCPYNISKGDKPKSWDVDIRLFIYVALVTLFPWAYLKLELTAIRNKLFQKHDL